MTANINLDGYPQVEYGILKATIKTIALMPEAMPTQTQEQTQAGYLLELTLPNGLNTTYKKLIPMKQEMPGTAEIITEERRILERILDRILNILKNN